MTKGLGKKDDQPFVLEGADLDERRCLLTLRGELDLDAVPLLQQAVDHACLEGTHHVSVDAADVHFIDSAGLMALIKAREQVMEAGGSLRLTAASRAVVRILQIALLADVLLDPPGVSHPNGESPPLA